MLVYYRCENDFSTNWKNPELLIYVRDISDFFKEGEMLLRTWMNFSCLSLLALFRRCRFCLRIIRRLLWLLMSWGLPPLNDPPLPWLGWLSSPTSPGKRPPGVATCLIVFIVEEKTISQWVTRKFNYDLGSHIFSWCVQRNKNPYLVTLCFDTINCEKSKHFVNST